MRSSIIAADLGLQNPNKYKLQLKRADINVSLNSHHLGRIFFNTLLWPLPTDITFYSTAVANCNKALIPISNRVVCAIYHLFEIGFSQ